MRWLLIVVLSTLAAAQVTVNGGISVKGGISVGNSNTQVTLAGENAYCGAGDVANFGGTDGPATLPTSCTNTAVANTPSPGSTVTVASDCSNLQTLINALTAGQTLVIPSTAPCTGNYTFPAVSGADINHWVTVRTDQTASGSFPAEGVQMTPCWIGLASVNGYPNYTCPSPATLLPSITTNSTNSPAIRVTGTFYRFIGLNITKSGAVTIAGNLITLDGSDHVIFDRCLIHGVEPIDFHTKAGVSTRGTHQAIINSWIYDIDWNQAEGYAISGGTGTQSDEGPIKLYNTLLEGASETWIWGGGGASAQAHDLEIRRNLSIHPLIHMKPVAAAVSSVNVKNNGELKNATRVLYEDNVAWGSWQGQSDQPGAMWNLNATPQSSFITTKFVNVSGTAVSCSNDAIGTACTAGTGWFAAAVSSGSRASNVVTLNVANTMSTGWPTRWFPSYHIVVQGITGTCSSFNGEQIITNQNTAGVIQFTLSGADIGSCGAVGASALVTDLIDSTCAPNGCRMNVGSTAAFPPYHITAVTDSEHITLAENLGTVTGALERTCSPGLAPQATVSHITIRYNYMSHAAATGMGPTNATSDCFDESSGVSNFSIHDLVWDDIDASFWTNQQNACCAGGTGAGPRTTSGYVNQATWPHDITFSHISGMGLRTWKNGGLGAGGLVVIDALYRNTAITNIQRTSNVATLTMASNTFVTGNTIQVSGFTTTYAGLNGTNLTVTSSTPTTLTYANTGSDIPSTAVSSGTTGSGVLNNWPFTYYKNLTFKDSFITSPFNWDINSGNVISGGVTNGFATNACNPFTPFTCTWNWTNIIQATAMYAGFTQSSASPYPTTNPDSSQTCTIGGHVPLTDCAVADFSGVVNSWNGAMGNVIGNDYHVKSSSAFYRAATDGKDIGADINHINAVITAVLPAFTFPSLTISTNSLTACTHNVYCEQQMLISNGASGANGFVLWTLTAGTLPTGMTFEGYGQAQVNGAYKTGTNGNAGWLWGTPTQTGNFPLTFQAEDAAHQKTSIVLTLTVN